jgi:hypothetical protein
VLDVIEKADHVDFDHCAHAVLHHSLAELM